MTWFRFWSQAYVLHLEDEIAYLRAQVAHERERAEQAIDQLLNVRVGVAPVSSTLASVAASASRATSPEDVMRKLLDEAPEFASVGVAE